MSDLPKFLKEKGWQPNVSLNPALNHLGTETAFGFGAKVMEVERSGKFPQVYKFHIGDTGPTTPEPIIEVARAALADKQTKYSHFAGFPQVRENIARYWTETRGIPITKDNIMFMPGGKPGIELTIQALLAEGDRIIIQNPGYPIYQSLASFYTHGQEISWPARHNEKTQCLEFVVADLEKILAQNSGIKILCLNTPQNPTGMMLTQAQLEQIAVLAQKYNFFVLFDDIYDQIVFGGRKHFSFLSIPGMLERTVNLNGLSKNYAMTGWRVGFVVAPAWLIEVFGRLAINKWSCVCREHQIATGAIFGEVEIDGHKYASVQEKIAPILRADYQEYERKGNFLYDCLNLLAPYVVPNPVEGAFYIFPNFTQILSLPYVRDTLQIKTDKDLSEWLLREKGIAVLAGRDFGSAGAGHIRFSYAEDRNKHVIPGMKYLLSIIIDWLEKSGEKSPLAKEEVEERVNQLVNKFFSS